LLAIGEIELTLVERGCDENEATLGADSIGGMFGLVLRLGASGGADGSEMDSGLPEEDPAKRPAIQLPPLVVSEPRLPDLPVSPANPLSNSER
jgi:hypothetical protein